MAKYLEKKGFSMFTRWRMSRVVRAALIGALVTAAPAALGGCRTDADNIERWTNTAQGPRKLVAVLTHDKYPLELRVEAAMALVRMPPRSGRRNGILGDDDQPGLVGALESLPPSERSKIVSSMVPRLEEQIRQAPPKAQAGHPAAADPTFPYKDAAYALLTHADGSLVQSDENRKRLRSALTDWAMADFPGRMDEPSQMFGMEQVLRYLGAEGVARLPEQIETNAKKIDAMANLIADLGSDQAKQVASQKLVDVAKEINSDRWIQQRAPSVEAANKASKLSPTPEQFKAQLQTYQEEELLRIFSSMKKIGGAPIVQYLLDFSRDKAVPEKRRAAALAALEGNIDRNNAQHVQSVLEIASAADTPDSVRDVALRRVGELPRKQVADKLFGLFDNENWKIRWVAAELILKMSDTGNIDQFYRELARAKGLSMTEPLRYGALLADMKGPQKPVDVAQKYAARDNPVNVRLSALGYWYERGTKADIGQIEPFVGERTKIPGCRDDSEDCEWKCAVDDGKDQQLKEIATVGDFVQYCIKPAMEKRSPPAPKK
jgi:hypothetical protein